MNHTFYPHRSKAGALDGIGRVVLEFPHVFERAGAAKMQSKRPISGGSSRSGRKDDKLLDHLRSMQQMEKDTQETLGKFMSVLSTHQATDYAGLLEEKIEDRGMY